MSTCAATGNRVQVLPYFLSNFESQASLDTLSNGEVQVWTSCRDIEQAELDDLKGLLASDELARAARFRFPEDRSRFITSRGVLRRMLGNYLRLDPRNLRFRYSEKGKPALDLDSDADLHFNVAHSDQAIVWAFTHSRRVGVDVEKISFDFAISEIAEHFFSQVERAALRSLPISQQHEAFFRCWARKEAYLKATGDGLSLPLGQFDVTLSPSQPALLLDTRPDHSEAERWILQSLELGPAYASAIVIERENARLA